MFEEFYERWILLNTILWALGFALGLLSGFVFPIIGDVIAVIIFVTLMIFGHVRLLNKFPWVLEYRKYAFIGFFIGLTLSFIFTLLSNPFIGLDLAHILAFPIVLGGTVIGQIYAFRRADDAPNTKNWVIANLIAAGLSFLVITILSIFIDFRIDLLNVRQNDPPASINWGLLGLVFGVFYGTFTGLQLRKL